jgi:ketosteroid isomerase-like protein
LKKIMRIVILTSFLLLLMSCDQTFPRKDPRQQFLAEMMQADADFAAMAAEKGYRKAFLQYMEDEAVLLRDNYLPIIGADAVRYVTGMNDSTFTVDWSPQGGDVSISGDMGYTFGIYELRTALERQSGTYVTVWRRQEDGSWKYLLDAGTQGLPSRDTLQVSE